MDPLVLSIVNLFNFVRFSNFKDPLVDSIFNTPSQSIGKYNFAVSGRKLNPRQEKSEKLERSTN